MTESATSKRRSTTAVIAVTVLLTLGITLGGGYLLGWIGPPAHVHEDGGETAAKSQKYTCGMHPWIVADEPGTCPICGMDLVPVKEAGAAETAASGERRVAYWRAPMNPSEIYDKPGKSAMGMDLVPVYEDELVGGVDIAIDPVTQQNMGVRLAKVEKAPLVHVIRTYGHVTYDETRTTEINPKFGGWIEKLYVDFVGRQVTAGQPLFDIYSPELLAAQEEYLGAYRSLNRNPGGTGQELLASARSRLANFDVAPSEIAALEKSGKVRRTLTFYSPFTGVVTQKNAVEGAFIKAGTPVFQLADLSVVWVEAHIYEYELPWVRVGMPVEMTLPYQPGVVFTGQITFIYPYLERKTRDVVLRLEFTNPELILKPDMYADVRIMSSAMGEGIVVPSEAVIHSGERNLVFVARGEGKFTPRQVTIGLSVEGGRHQILGGLAPGETIVTSGQFLLDSESKLKEAVQKMMEPGKAPAPAGEKAPAEDDFFDDMKKS